MEFNLGLFLNRGVEKIKLLVLPTAGIGTKTGMSCDHSVVSSALPLDFQFSL